MNTGAPWLRGTAQASRRSAVRAAPTESASTLLSHCRLSERYSTGRNSSTALRPENNSRARPCSCRITALKVKRKGQVSSASPRAATNSLATRSQLRFGRSRNARTDMERLFGLPDFRIRRVGNVASHEASSRTSFLRIHDKKLTIVIDTDSDDDLQRHDLMTIDNTTLERWFGFLLACDDDSGDSGEWSLEEAQVFWKLVRGESAIVKEKQDPDLGHCRLWIKVDERLPSKVALARQTGMVITTQQKHLVRFPNMEDFAALCLFDSEKGNALLQGMENPQHNQFEPNWLPEGDQRRGRRALDRIVKWIRAEIRELATREVSGDTTVVTELARLLPDSQPDEAFGVGDDEGEPSFDGGPVIRHRQLRRRVARLKDDHEAEGDDGEGNDLGPYGGGGGGGGQGSGDGNGGLRRRPRGQWRPRPLVRPVNA